VFFGVTGLVTQLLESQEERGLHRLLGHLTRQDLLVLDELGYVPFTKAGAELLFEVASQAYERQSLVVTTNLPFEQWPEVCGSERLPGVGRDSPTARETLSTARRNRGGDTARHPEASRRMICLP